jgi:hypothetical protein
MTFRALNNRVLWGTTELTSADCRYLVGLYLDNGSRALYWSLHDAMTEAGMIPSRPVETPDLSYQPPAAEPWPSTHGELQCTSRP